jgi:hypothetical protein
MSELKKPICDGSTTRVQPYSHVFYSELILECYSTQLWRPFLTFDTRMSLVQYDFHLFKVNCQQVSRWTKAREYVVTIPLLEVFNII